MASRFFKASGDGMEDGLNELRPVRTRRYFFRQRGLGISTATLASLLGEGNVRAVG